MGSFTTNSAPSRTPAWNSSLAAGFSPCPLIYILLMTFMLAPLSRSQTPTGKPANNSEAQQSAPPANPKPAEVEKNPAQIELLETKYRFETNGDSRKEVHTRVRINNELGVRQFARLNFDFNRSFQAVDIPMVHVTHPSGGSADILPSAITDNPNPAVVDYPAYHDVRVKSVRILGLQPGDLLEYRVITTTTHHPLAPNFWLDHTFDRTGVVTQEQFELDLPVAGTRMEINPKIPATNVQKSESRAIYRWDLTSEKAPAQESLDVVVTTFPSWDALAEKLESEFRKTADSGRAAKKKASELAVETAPHELKLRASYDFVAGHIKTVDLPLGSMGFHSRAPDDILASGYGTAEDKYVLLRSFSEDSLAAMTGRMQKLADQLPAPSLLSALVVVTPLTFVGPGCEDCVSHIWLDPAVEVAPFGMIPANLRGMEAIGSKKAFFQVPGAFLHVTTVLPFNSTQRVTISGNLASNGTLVAKVKYALRGDNELLLRVAFHKTPKDKWINVAQMLALSDGFRGQITDVTTSDPSATKQPFTVEYEISQPKFIDWSKKTVRIPAILPLPGLPDSPTAAQRESKKPIELGTPLAIDLETAIELPAGATAQVPIGTTVNRDYATFSSKYSVQGNTLHASRSLHFLSSELPASRATDFNAFLHAVQADQAQLFTVQAPMPK